MTHHKKWEVSIPHLNRHCHKIIIFPFYHAIFCPQLWGSVFQEALLCPGPGRLPDTLTLDFWVEGHVKQTPAQCRRSCLRSSKEQVQGTDDEVFVIEAWCRIVRMLESTMFINLFRGFSVATTHRGFTWKGRSPGEMAFPSVSSGGRVLLQRYHC